jgi:hypothetical protein
VAVDRYAEQVANKEKGMVQIKSDLSAMRGKYVCSGCESEKTNLEGAMAKRVVRFKEQNETLTAMRETLDGKREAYEMMEAAYEKQRSDRDTLSNKLESLRAEYDSMKMRGELEKSSLVDSASRKATDLAIEIKDRLEIQRRLSDLRSNGVESLSKKSDTPIAFDRAELDKILSDDLEVAIN